MQKNIEEKLKGLAERILKLDNDADIDLLKNEALQLYNELCILTYIKNKPKKIKTSKKKDVQKNEDYNLFSIEKEIGVDANFEDIFVKKEGGDMKSMDMPFDISAALNEDVEEVENSEINELKEESVTIPNETQSLNTQVKIASSLNDKINSSISVDLNDRIAFVNYLFEGSQEDFNRVLSQLNSFEKEHEAKDFLLNQVKPDYSWQGHESYEERLIFLIERKFM